MQGGIERVLRVALVGLVDGREGIHGRWREAIALVHVRPGSSRSRRDCDARMNRAGSDVGDGVGCRVEGGTDPSGSGRRRTGAQAPCLVACPELKGGICRRIASTATGGQRRMGCPSWKAAGDGGESLGLSVVTIPALCWRSARQVDWRWTMDAGGRKCGVGVG